MKHLPDLIRRLEGAPLETPSFRVVAPRAVVNTTLKKNYSAQARSINHALWIHASQANQSILFKSTHIIPHMLHARGASFLNNFNPQGAQPVQSRSHLKPSRSGQVSS